MKITFDQKHDVMYIKFRKGKYETSKEVGDDIIIDMTKDNKIMAIEILNASEKISPSEMKKISVSAVN